MTTSSNGVETTKKGFLCRLYETSGKNPTSFKHKICTINVQLQETCAKHTHTENSDHFLKDRPTVGLLAQGKDISVCFRFILFWKKVWQTGQVAQHLVNRSQKSQPSEHFPLQKNIHIKRTFCLGPEQRVTVFDGVANQKPHVQTLWKVDLISKNLHRWWPNLHIQQTQNSTQTLIVIQKTPPWRQSFAKFTAVNVVRGNFGRKMWNV